MYFLQPTGRPLFLPVLVEDEDEEETGAGVDDEDEISHETGFGVDSTGV